MSGLEARMQSRQLHRDRWTRDDRVGIDGVERADGEADAFDGRDVALEVALGIGLRAGGFAEHVVGKAVAFLLVLSRPRNCVFDGAAEHKLLAEKFDRLADGLANERLAGAGDEALQRVDGIRRLAVLQLDEHGQ